MAFLGTVPENVEKSRKIGAKTTVKSTNPLSTSMAFQEVPE